MVSIASETLVPPTHMSTPPLSRPRSGHPYPLYLRDGRWSPWPNAVANLLGPKLSFPNRNGNGGQAYFLGFETPVSFAPYLEDLSRRLNHQYLLAFLAKPEKKPGLQRVRVKTEVKNVELVAATKVFVPAGS